MKKIMIVFLFFVSIQIIAEDGYRLWLRYDKISDSNLLKEYKTDITGVYFAGESGIMNSARHELEIGLNGLLDQKINFVKSINRDGIVVATKFNTSLLSSLRLEDRIKTIGTEGFLINTIKLNGKKIILITGNEDAGVLYGVFHFLRILQTHGNIQNLDIVSSPKIKLRLLNHWDNLDGTIERGYAGFSFWDWHRLPDYISPRYRDYARADASVGINGVSLTNVNANSYILRNEYLLKVKALADIFREYGIKVYLTARFSSPIELGKLNTADPLDNNVRTWWNKKAEEIYRLIPDFGGFLVKANSEGQPGPQNYGRNHADGANMLADAVKPFGGIVMWRAFVYDNNVRDDRAKQAHNEFKPLDGKFRDNVLVQVKNGAIDFQPREPFHPLFGAMPKTPLIMEFQLTQEYLGQATQLVYLAPMYKECLESDTYAQGEGSIVSKVIDGSLDNHSLTGIAGVANTGSDRNWTGHLFGQANWYAFGKLAWNHQLTSEQIADEWIRMTFTNDVKIIEPIKKIMMNSRENCVNYMTPLGLHHLMGWDHHYGPEPWTSGKAREDWMPKYYHKADSIGIGFDRTSTGSNATSQYSQKTGEIFSSLNICPEKYLLWFHHLPWNYKMSGRISGSTLWNELVARYYKGVDDERESLKTWNTLEGKIDQEEFEHVKMLLGIQVKEAVWWRNACVLYFQTFSKQPIPPGYEKPDKTLDYYMSLEFPYAPGILKTIH
jgi:alpha-glucuronidase